MNRHAAGHQCDPPESNRRILGFNQALYQLSYAWAWVSRAAGFEPATSG